MELIELVTVILLHWATTVLSVNLIHHERYQQDDDVLSNRYGVFPRESSDNIHLNNNPARQQNRLEYP